MLNTLFESRSHSRNCVVGVNEMTNDLLVRRLPVRLEGDARRVTVPPFPLSNGRVRPLFERIDRMDEDAAARLLPEVEAGYGDRHANLHATFDEHFAIGCDMIGWG